MELRKDYVLDRWVIINPKRGKRPHEFKIEKEKEKKKKIDKDCFFCIGNEKLTPPEIGRIEEKGKWVMRWFPNKFAVVQLEGNPEIKTDNTYFTYSSAYGTHEVIVETNDHSKQLWDLPEKRIKQVLDIYKQRIEELSKINGIKYVSVFKNHGKMAGTSLQHSHSQVVAYNEIPNTINRICTAIKQHDHCPYCDIINIEKGSDRRAFENEHIVAFCPYASRFNYEIWIFPKRHVKAISELNEEEMVSLSQILKQTLAKLKEIGAEFNMFLNYSPDEHDLHFSMKISPRIAIWAGFEYSTDCVINSVPPEDAAKFYRGEE